MIKLLAAFTSLVVGIQVAGASVADGIEKFYRGEYGAARERLLAHTADAVAQRYLGQIYDINYHSLWTFSSRSGGVSVYSGGVGHDVEAMLRHYGQAIATGSIVARYQYCDWVASPYWNDGSYLRDSKCKRVSRDFKREAKARKDDPIFAYYHWVVRSGDLGTPERREHARALLTPGAKAGNHIHQYYLGLVYLGFNARKDRPSDYDNAYAWLKSAATLGNYHARVKYTFLKEFLREEDLLDQAEKRADELFAELDGAR